MLSNKSFGRPLKCLCSHLTPSAHLEALTRCVSELHPYMQHVVKGWLELLLLPG